MTPLQLFLEPFLRLLHLLLLLLLKFLQYLKALVIFVEVLEVDLLLQLFVQRALSLRNLSLQVAFLLILNLNCAPVGESSCQSWPARSGRSSGRFPPSALNWHQ